MLPTPEHEDRFWSLLEDAWAPQSKKTNKARRKLAERRPGKDVDVEDLEEAWEDVQEHLEAACAELTTEELTDLDRVVERKLYNLDRADLQEVTDGSDGFLYARGFIVAMGRTYYEAVKAEPRLAVPDAEAEEMCYLFAHLHQDRFGTFPETNSGISRESCSNPAGWPTLTN
jgi:enamine deaminase RidA (YjgF/YER057c/UK114 family)